MNKVELVEAIAKEANLSKKDADAAVKAFIGTVSKELSNGNDVQLIGFGTFSTAERPARQGRNPKTGEKIDISATTVPKFKPGKSLKDLVNKK